MLYNYAVAWDVCASLSLLTSFVLWLLVKLIKAEIVFPLSILKATDTNPNGQKKPSKKGALRCQPPAIRPEAKPLLHCMR
ncbi:hypothetical protein BH09BAC3_BH09BAC3_38140 [soil metagenome]